VPGGGSDRHMADALRDLPPFGAYATVPRVLILAVKIILRRENG
jgi:hypothetical protein